jgi:hypothetical protein
MARDMPANAGLVGADLACYLGIADLPFEERSVNPPALHLRKITDEAFDSARCAYRSARVALCTMDFLFDMSFHTLSSFF